MERTYLFGHVDDQTALKVDDYPWGFRLRTSIFYWIETEPKKGDRFCSMTIDPKTGRKCKPKKSTYSNIAVLYRDEKGHIHYTGLTIYSKAEEREAFITAIGGDTVLNAEQMTQLRQLRGEVIVKINEFTGAKKKDFAVKWEREIIGAGWKDGVYNPGEKGECNEVKITFDRPDGVSVKEIYEAMRSLNQDKLKEVFRERPSTWHVSGFRTGIVRICTRGGSYLGTVDAEGYQEYLASDHVAKETENA